MAFACAKCKLGYYSNGVALKRKFDGEQALDIDGRRERLCSLRPSDTYRRRLHGKDRSYERAFEFAIFCLYRTALARKIVLPTKSRFGCSWPALMHVMKSTRRRRMREVIPSGAYRPFNSIETIESEPRLDLM